MSLVGMLKQYATAGGVGANDATERIGKAFQNELAKESPKKNNRYLSPQKQDDLSDLSEEYYSDFGSMGMKNIDDMKVPDLPKQEQSKNISNQKQDATPSSD